MARALDRIDRQFVGKEGTSALTDSGVANVALHPAPPWQPSIRLLRRTFRSLRRRTRAGRTKIPRGWPGSRRYIDL